MAGCYLARKSILSWLGGEVASPAGFLDK